jgi:hypothetical protein
MYSTLNLVCVYIFTTYAVHIIVTTVVVCNFKMMSKFVDGRLRSTEYGPVWQCLHSGSEILNYFFLLPYLAIYLFFLIKKKKKDDQSGY